MVHLLLEEFKNYFYS